MESQHSGRSGEAVALRGSIGPRFFPDLPLDDLLALLARGKSLASAATTAEH